MARDGPRTGEKEQKRLAEEKKMAVKYRAEQNDDEMIR